MHRLNRYEIVLRSKLFGLDLWLLVRTIWLMATGKRGLYLVTQPDLLLAVPFLRYFFPDAAIITWTWTAGESKAWFRQYSECSHVLCLTAPARDELVRLGLPAARCSFPLWGADPSFYQQKAGTGVENEVLFFGLTGRDTEVVRAAVARAQFCVSVSPLAATSLGLAANPNVKVLPDRAGYDAIIEMLQSSLVIWIPLVKQAEPAGFTNLVEALLCGTAVVVDDSSTIPEEALALPGVYLYRHGDTDSLIEMTNQALAAARADDFRDRVRLAAAAVLNGEALRSTIEMVLDGTTPRRETPAPASLAT